MAKSSRLSRALSLGKLGARVAVGRGRRLLSGAKGAAQHEELAALLVAELGQLKGLPMKIGQLLSYMDGVMPAEARDTYRRVLGSLCTQSPPMPFETVRKQLQDAFGAGAMTRFSRFEQTPMASASIGQVHLAEVDGIEVCVKVQYPDIAEAIESDLRNVDAIIALVRRAVPTVDTTQMIDDFRERLREECDYEREAEYQARFAAIWADDPDIAAPEVLSRHCAPKVLTTVRARGLALDRFVAQADEAARDRAARGLFRFAFGSLLGHGLFHADPHPGNLLFAPDGALTVLDYGCVQPVDADARDALAGLVRAARDQAPLEAPARNALGLHDVDDVTLAALLNVTREVLRPVSSPQPYHFTRDFAATIAKATVDAKMALGPRALTRKARFKADREGVMFVIRNLFGLASIWGELDARFDVRAALEPYLGPQLMGSSSAPQHECAEDRRR